jgi:hypothetical protein
MSLADRDIYLIHIEHEIEIKRKKLLEKQKKVCENAKINRFLEMVKQDYLTYHAIIMKQKEEQLRALSLLKQYVQDLTDSGTLSKQNIKDGEFEQKRILQEMNKIKKDLDYLIQHNNQILQISSKTN